MLNLQVIAKPVLVLWTAKLPQGLLLDLADPLPGNAEDLPYTVFKKCSVKNYDKLEQISGKHSPLCLIFSSSSPKSSLS